MAKKNILTKEEYQKKADELRKQVIDKLWDHPHIFDHVKNRLSIFRQKFGPHCFRAGSPNNESR